MPTVAILGTGGYAGQDTLEPGDDGSAFGGTPIGCAAAGAADRALDTLEDVLA